MKRFLNFAALACVLAFLVGCDGPKNVGDTIMLVRLNGPEFDGCVAGIANISKSSSDIYIVRCPNSATSVQYRSGKTTVNNVTVDRDQEVEQARQVIERDNARRAALEKLSPEDRRLLGLENGKQEIPR